MKLYGKEIPKPIVYLSGGHTGGTDAAERKWLRRTGCKFRCFSFGYTCPGAFYYNKRMAQSLQNSIDYGVGIMMDSGAFSFHKFIDNQTGQIAANKNKSMLDVNRLKDETIEKYVEYCKAHSKEWDFYVNFDYVRDAQVVYKIQKQLEKAGLRQAVPVYHGHDSIDWLERYCKEGYKLVGISGSARNTLNRKAAKSYFGNVFDITEKYGVKVHGFAITSLSLMFQYPFYSVDSTTWVKPAGFGKIIYVDKRAGILGQIHVSRQASSHQTSYNNLPKAQQREVRRMVEDHGFDLEKLRDDLYERSTFNACIFTKHLHQLKDYIKDSNIEWESLI